MKLSVGDAPPADKPRTSSSFSPRRADRRQWQSGDHHVPHAEEHRSHDAERHCICGAVDQPIPPGSYGQIRLMVTADGSANNSYIDFADGRGSAASAGGSERASSWSQASPSRAAASSTTRSTSTCARRSPARRGRLPRAS